MFWLIYYNSAIGVVCSKNYMNKLLPKKWLRKNVVGLVLGLFVVCYFFLFLYLTFARHDGLKSYMNDLGNMDQPIYNTTKGNFMLMTNLPTTGLEGKNRFGGHANFILLFFVPIYYFFANPKILLFTQTLMISLGALPLYWLGKRLFEKKKWLSLVVPFIYLINPTVHDVNLFDFHPIAIAMPLILFAFYFMYTKRYGWFSFFAVLIALCKEDMPLIIFMFGLYVFFVQKEKWKGVVTCFLSLIYFFLVLKVIMPFFNNGEGSELIAQRYSYLGGDIGRIIVNLITKPWLVLVHLISKIKIAYVTVLLLPTFFLPLLTPNIFLLSLPSLLINLLSSNPMMYVPFHYYHAAPILPFIFLATLFSFYKLSTAGIRIGRCWVGSKDQSSKQKFGIILNNQTLKFNTKIITVVLLLFSSFIKAIYSPTIYSWKKYEVTSHAKAIKNIKKLIPKEASLSVQLNLGPHFSQRTKIYTFPLNMEMVDYVLLDINDPYVSDGKISNMGYYNLSVHMSFDMSFQDYYDKVVSLFGNKDYGVEYYSDDGYLLFKKGSGQEKNKEAFDMFNKNAKLVFGRYEEHELEYIDDFNSI